MHVNYLGSEPLQYGIYPEPIDPYYKKYVDGGSIKQYGFAFITNAHISSLLFDQLEATGFYEKFEKWIEENNKQGIVPDIDGAIEIQILTNGFLAAAEADMARFHIQLKLIYMED